MRGTAAVVGICLGIACGGPRAWVVDRVEDEVAVLVGDDARARVVDLASLPPGAKEGEVLRNGRLDENERERLRAQVRASRERLLTGAGTFSLEAP